MATAEEAARKLRDWVPPDAAGKYLSGLVMRNSLTGDAKVAFVPETGRHVNWYCCGPTVYDTAHMGHARTYVACDTVRSILERYFNYDVSLVVNVTDIDDKIIQRANAEGRKFDELASYWEREFWADMAALGVEPPNVMTRVSEFVPEIIAYIETIISNGYAYESEGSVYFDIEAFRTSGKHAYPKLEPASYNDLNRITDAEGTLGEVSRHKKSRCDFALWKRAKEGEPSWPSPWGDGRPGWHIECSAMCSNVFGKDTVVDIHSGGIDLRFPHHDNEIAQSEAFTDKNRWVNYFLHFGHLNIQGLKMSKSLKNFISIKQMLQKYNKRQIRLLFLSARYDGTLNYSPDAQGMAVAVATDETLFNFFALLNSRMDKCEGPQKLGEHDRKLALEFEKLRETVHEAFADNFDTPKALQAICAFVGTLNAHLSAPHAQLRHAQGVTFKKYLYKILEVRYIETIHLSHIIVQVLKLVEPGLEYGAERATDDSLSRPLLDQLVQLRTKTRQFAQECMRTKQIDVEKTTELLRTCDQVRDKHLPNLGILIEDRDDGECVVKFKSKWVYPVMIHIRGRDEQLKEAQRKEELKQQRLQQEEERQRLLNTPPTEFIAKKFPGKFAQFDEQGLPTHLADGAPVSKSERQSMTKVLQKHTQQYLKRQEASA